MCSRIVFFNVLTSSQGLVVNPTTDCGYVKVEPKFMFITNSLSQCKDSCVVEYMYQLLFMVVLYFIVSQPFFYPWTPFTLFFR